MSTKKKILPEVSIIICAYNHEKWIKKCLLSLIAQKYLKKKTFEIILVNDFSKDGTKNLLKSFKKIKNLRIINNSKNIGLPSSINKAIHLSRGKYLVRVDSDDYVNKYFLMLMKLFLDSYKKYQAVEVDYLKVDERNNIISNDQKKEKIACGIMFRRECLYEVGLYNTKFKMREGHELRRRFTNKFKIGKLTLPLYYYRMHAKNRTKSKKVIDYDKILKRRDNFIN